MNFPLIQHKEFKAWIPSTDIDEIDVQPGVLTEALNVDFRNGYLENSQNAVVLTHPTDIQTDISAGYELLSMKGFTHSEKGDTTIYILYKETDPISIKIWLTGGGETSPKLMNIDEQSSQIIWLEKPRDINYNLVNNQLKINLNCVVRYNQATISEEVIANLTLIYVDNKIYKIGAVQRSIGWYLFPRWLGWSYPNDSITFYNQYPLGEFYEDFEDSSYIPNLGDVVGYSTWQRGIIPVPFDVLGNIFSARGVYNQTSVLKAFVITGLRNVKKIEFKYGSAAYAVSPNPPYAVTPVPITSGWLRIEIKYQGDLDFQPLLEFGVTDLTYLPDAGNTKELILNSKTNTTFELRFIAQSPQASGAYTFSFIYIDNIKITPMRVAVIGLFESGQRALLTSGNLMSIYGDANLLKMSFNKLRIDWRVIDYEIYVEQSDNIFYLMGSAKIEDGWVEQGAYSIEKNVTLVSEDDPIKTLTFAYSLPADTRVDNQRLIYMEVEHKGRIFFIKDDYKVYQSHISANMAVQADAFPYDEEVGFGYFITSHNRINRGIAITPTNYLAIFTDSGFYVYYIQPSSTGSFKTLRLSSGSIGLSSRSSITKALTGDPATDGLFWVDDNGVYFYTGDSQPPKNLILPAHEKYWRENVSPIAKANTVGFYNPLKREYWLKVGSDAIGETVSNDYMIVYELPYDNWKRQRFTNLGLDEFYGVFNNVLYYRSGNQFVKLDMSTKSIFVIETPYNTGYITGQQGYQRVMPEIYDKIIQEVYMVFADGNVATDVYMETIVDGISLGTLTFNPTMKFEKFLTPLGVRFNRVKFKVSNSEVGHTTRIKEFGCSYTLDTKEPLGQQMVDDQPSDNYGYGRSYGRAYGRN